MIYDLLSVSIRSLVVVDIFYCHSFYLDLLIFLFLFIDVLVVDGCLCRRGLNRFWLTRPTTGRVRGRDGSRDSINPPYINLPSPNVQDDVIQP